MCAMAAAMETPASAFSGDAPFERLSRRHGIKIVPEMACSVEECSLAVGETVGYESILSASRMNSAVVIFLDTIEKVNKVVQSGVVIKDTFTPVMPLSQPVRKITLSNVPPFVKDDLLLAELSRHGKIVSKMKKIPLGCKSPLLKHVVCFRRQVHMILKSETEELSVAFKFKVDGYDYVVFASSETMRCFGCGQEGHLRRFCKEKNENIAPAQDGGGAVEEEQVEDEVRNDGNLTEVMVEEVIDTDMGEKGGDGEGVNAEFSNVIEMAESVLEGEGEGEGMCNELGKEEEVFKTPSTKRKRVKPNIERPGSSSNKFDDGEQSTLEDSDSEVTGNRNSGRLRSDYSFGKIRSFLQKTKNMKNVQVVDFFSDREMFIESVGTMMRGEGSEQFTVQEIFRLKKFVAKLRRELQTENGFETT